MTCQVVEDYGGIGRTTQTLQYDSQGRAVKVQDASGKVFHTTYDADGVISSIEKIVGSTSTPASHWSGRGYLVWHWLRHLRRTK